jgi:Bacterial archaeo-eukaryotic release factor family 6
MTLISREEIRTILEQPRQNSVSIYMPMQIAGPEVRQNSIRFKNLIKEAESKLIDAGIEHDDAVSLLAQAHQIDTTDFWEKVGEQGLVVFVSKDFFRYYTLPLNFEELVVVTDRFHIKPLLPLLNGEGRFYLLALSQQDVRFFDGSHYSIQEVEVENMPKSLAEALQYDETAQDGQFRIATSKGGTANSFQQPGAFHGQGSPDRDQHQKDILQFFYAVSHALEEKLQNQTAPLLLAGVEYLFPLYREANTYQHLVKEGITGNQEILSPQELHERAWPIVEPLFYQSQQEVVERFNMLFGSNTGKASNNLREIIPAAYYQRIDTLLVSTDNEQWGLFDSGSDRVIVHETEETGDEDLLDFAAAYTLLNGGTVYAVESNQVPFSTPVAAIFRY